MQQTMCATRPCPVFVIVMSLEGIVPASTTGPLARKSEVTYETFKQDFVKPRCLHRRGAKSKENVTLLGRFPNGRALGAQMQSVS